MKLICTTLCFFFICSLFWMERKHDKDVSRAVWVPFIWIFFVGSRPLSQWLRLEAPMRIPGIYIESDPLNAGLFLVLVIAGTLILWRRRLDWKKLFTQNIWVWLFFIFSALSILWSDFRVVALQRLLKSCGTVVMALVILSEEHPYEAFGTLLKRLAFILLPLSILFIRCYPSLGTSLSHLGNTFYSGVTTHKNSLGQLCMILGIYLCWRLLFPDCKGADKKYWRSFFQYFVIFPMLAWLLYKSNSATSMACLIFAVCLFLLTRMPGIYLKPRRIIALCVAGVLLVAAVQLIFHIDIKRRVAAILDRKVSLEDRTLMWKYLESNAGNPWVGVGYESFWMGSRLAQARESVWLGSRKFVQPLRNSHNGYLETYLNLGYIGLALILCNIFSGLLKAWKDLSVDFATGILRLSFIIAVVLYNYTEATFSGVSNVLLLFWLGAIGPVLKSRGAKVK